MRLSSLNPFACQDFVFYFVYMCLLPPSFRFTIHLETLGHIIFFFIFKDF